MKKAILTLFIALLMLSCYQQERNCQDYRTGSFTFEYVLDGEQKMGRFTRGEKYSVDYYDNAIDSATVKWVNDCEFVLQDLKTKASVHMKILSTTDNSYTFEYGLVGEAKKMRGTAISTK